MNSFDPLDSILTFLSSWYAFAAFAVVLVLALVFWSDRLKKRYYDGIEKKKWRTWNSPRTAQEDRFKRRNPPAKR